MTSKLIPSDPSSVTVIRKVTENILTFSAPFNRSGTIKFGGRGTVVRLESGALAVFSPVALTAEAKDNLKQFGGPVKYLAALDFEHHIFLGDWHAAFPEAKVIGPEGLPEKKKNAGQAVRFDVVFTPQNKATLKVDEEFDREFDYEYVDGHQNKELAFNFKRERTLIQADLIFNLPAIEQYSKSPESPHAGFINKIAVGGLGITSGAAMQKRILWYALTKGNRPSFNASAARIDTWDFDRIIPCHGDVIESGGKGVWRKMMGNHLAAAKAA